jgi:calcineurin-like phosphoesterase
VAEGNVQMNTVFIDVNPEDGRALKIERVTFHID